MSKCDIAKSNNTGWLCPNCGRGFQKTNQDHFCGKPAAIDAYIAAQRAEINPRLYEFDAEIRKVPDSDGANIVFPHDIRSCFDRAVSAGFTPIQPVTEMPERGLSNAMLAAPFGYIWMLGPMHRVVSFEERTAYWDEKLEGGESPEA